jgi:hypothetical protein
MDSLASRSLELIFDSSIASRLVVVDKREPEGPVSLKALLSLSCVSRPQFACLDGTGCEPSEILLYYSGVVNACQQKTLLRFPLVAAPKESENIAYSHGDKI